MPIKRLLRNARTWIGLAALVLAAASSVALRAQQLTQPVRPSDPAGREGRQVSLRDQLRVGLKAVTKADLLFVDLVVARVNQGVLPRSLVDSTFLWARRRVETRSTQYRKRPIVFFQPALVMRAKAIGVTL